ncbi:MAG: cytochrome C [Gallionella sp.]
MKSIVLSVVLASGLMVAGSAMAFSTGACKACHAVSHDVVGPAWKTVAKEYGNAKTLAGVFKAGFKPADRKVAVANPKKWKNMEALMTGQFKNLIKGHEDEAAAALFAAVKAGKI